MPIPLSSLTADRRTVRVPFGEDALTLTYKPSAVNAVQEARELEEREKGQHLLAQARSLAELIVSWDVVDEKGKPLPVSEEILGSLGLDVAARLQRAILEDLLPNQTPRTGSRNGSSQTASSVPSRTGTSS